MVLLGEGIILKPYHPYPGATPCRLLATWTGRTSAPRTHQLCGGYHGYGVSEIVNPPKNAWFNTKNDQFCGHASFDFDIL